LAILSPPSPFKELAQNGPGIKRAARRSGEFLSRLAARIRALCASEGKLHTLSWLPVAAVVGALALIFAAVAATYATRYALAWPALTGIYACFVVQVAEALVPGFLVSREILRRYLRPWHFPAVWCLPYLLYAIGTGDWRWAAASKLLAIAILAVAIYAVFPVRDATRFNWQDALLALLLIAAVLSHQLGGIWNIPVNLDFLLRLYLITVAIWTWIFVRPVPDLGYELRVSWPILKAATVNFGLFAVIAIPLGLLLHFTAWNTQWHGAAAFSLNYLEIFLFIALLEETFFRGFLQTLLTNSLRSWWRGQLLVSCLFGFFHILHAPSPNWRYVLLATIAGWFYGSAFRQSGSLFASSLVHATVDTVWRTWFSSR
jgi:membrane protease YdiL (CAAX protease family)